MEYSSLKGEESISQTKRWFTLKMIIKSVTYVHCCHYSVRYCHGTIMLNIYTFRFFLEQSIMRTINQSMLIHAITTTFQAWNNDQMINASRLDTLIVS